MQPRGYSIPDVLVKLAQLRRDLDPKSRRGVPEGRVAEGMITLIDVVELLLTERENNG